MPDHTIDTAGGETSTDVVDGDATDDVQAGTFFNQILDTFDDDLARRMLTTAWYYATLGLPVFPVEIVTSVDARGTERTRKKPMIKGWPQEATTDQGMVQRWWGHEFRGALIGVVTGTRSGWGVIDVDVKNGGRGFESLRKLADEVAPVTSGDTLALSELDQARRLDPSAITSTRSGGLHLWYRLGEHAKTRSRNKVKGLPDLEFKATGSYVVVAPSDGYSWVEHLPADTGPGEASSERLESAPVINCMLLDRLLDGTEADGGNGNVGDQDPDDVKMVARGFGRRVLTAGIERLVTCPEGDGNNTIFQVACDVYPYAVLGELARAEIDDEIMTAIFGWYDERDNTPRGTLDSAWNRTHRRTCEFFSGTWNGNGNGNGNGNVNVNMKDLVSAYLDSDGDSDSDDDVDVKTDVDIEVEVDRDTTDDQVTVTEFDFTLPPPGDPLAVADHLARYWWTDGEHVTLRYWRDDWYRWVGTHWAVTTDREVRDEAYLVTGRSFHVTDRGELRPWNPSIKSINALLDALKAVVRIAPSVETGSWLHPGDAGADKAGSRVAPCRNVLLDLASRETTVVTARFFTTYSLGFEYDPGAACPRWERFLGEVTDNDSQAVSLLQEWFGYVVSGDTRRQKMMYLVGPPSAGKGTVSRVLRHLVGDSNTASPTLSSFATNFGLSSLINKPLAVVGDARFSARLDGQVILERLLSITGEDALDVDRKNRDIWTGSLPTRLMFLSNDLPNFRDHSAAIMRRLLVLRFAHSFQGREDTGLEAELLAELPGVMNWALAGLDRLEAVGRFTTPVSAEDDLADIRDQASPVAAFLRERCAFGSGLEVSADALFTEWFHGGGCVHDNRASRTTFGNAIKSAFPEVVKERRRIGDGRKEFYYVGLALIQPGYSLYNKSGFNTD